jgi:hypothetical protein
MNFKKSALASAITLATFATGAAAFDASSWEVSGFVKNETAAFQSDGNTIGAYKHKTTADNSTAVDQGDLLKFENTAKIFVNGDVSENAALHAELNFVYDSEATPNDYEGHMSYSQNDYLRELYVDTAFGENNDVEVRVGKQQVVWGTADGMKLLDIINPTDYREFAQNTMEDSRIPVWMIKADMPVGDSGSMQFVVSQAEENKIAGLSNIEGGTRTYSTNKSNDQGNPFIMKGVDTISGRYNGFLNIAPDMGQFAGSMSSFASPLSADFGASVSSADLDLWQTTPFATIFEGADAAMGANALGTYYPQFVGFSQSSLSQDSAVLTTSAYSPSAPKSVFDLMGGTTAATMAGFANIKSEYRKKLPDDFDANAGLRFKGFTDSGTNYSLNYLYAYDSNPSVTMHWEDASGNRLSTTTSFVTGSNATQAGTNGTGSGGYYVALSGTADRIVFEEKLNRVHNFGGSFDTTIESESLPVVLRGEFLYQKDVLSPVIDKGKLFVGDLVGALQMEEGDWFKYVIGADINVLTNMMVSAQFIQFRNLDYVDQAGSYSDRGGIYAGKRKYTADPSTMHITNGLQQARENKEFYSLFLSKPFGANQLGRWNNIFIFEEGGGKWNRFDVEYSFSDELVGSFELNNYWGDTNTQFGQMEDSSNIQVGLKYLF